MNGIDMKLTALSYACPVKQLAGLPVTDRGFTGELSAFYFELQTLSF
jgi:hypothetical protein